MATFSPQQAKLLIQKNALNLADKLKAGETLSEKQLAILESIAEGGEATGKQFADTQDELAKALGVDRKTIQRHLKKPNAPVKVGDRYNIVAWREYLRQHGRKDDYGEDEADITREKARSIILQNERLEFQIKVLRKEYVSTVEVEQWGAHLGAEIRKTVTSIHKVASSLAGLPTPEIEIRLRELEDELLSKLHLLAQRVDDAKEASNVADE